jgi:alpha-1,2-mannosyltransferase
LWLLAVAVVGVIGFALARRAYRAGDPIAEVAAVGLMAVLLSPVAWVHHFAWVVVVIAALLGDGRDRRRLVYAAIITAWFLARLPWWGISWVANDWPVLWFGRILQNSYCLGGLLALALLWRVVPKEARQPVAAEGGVEVERGLPLGQ